MPDAQPEVVADILMYSALDHTRKEIAQKLGEDHDMTISDRRVGGIINELEDRAVEGDPRDVFYTAIMRGAGAEAGAEFGDFVQALSNGTLSADGGYGEGGYGDGGYGN
jgi:hypothetical protein